MRNKILYGLLLIGGLGVFAILAFYIVHNAAWMLGDDAIIMRKTGFGKPFYPTDNIFPEMGRFFPGAYLMYNVLLPFCSNHIGPYAIYILHLIVFVLFSICYLGLIWRIVKPKSVYDLFVVLLFTFLALFRVHGNFIICFSTLWFGFFLVAFFMYMYYCFLETDKTIYAVGAIVALILYMYRLESNFVLPLIVGIGTLLLAVSRKQMIVGGIILLNVLVFFICYYFISYRHVIEFYDGSHGLDTTIWETAIRTFRSQKVLWVALPMLLYRLYCIFVRKNKFLVYDMFLLAAAAQCWAGWILKLNWSMYYHEATLLSIPAILYYCRQLLPKYIYVAMVCGLTSLYAIKTLWAIEDNQEQRYLYKKHVTYLVNNVDDVLWFSPVVDYSNWDTMFRDLYKGYLQTYMSWILNDMNYQIPVAEIYDKRKTIWIVPDGNEKLIPGVVEPIQKEGKLLFELYYLKVFSTE